MHRGESVVRGNGEDYCFFSTKTLANPTTTISREPKTCWVMGESEILMTTKYRLFAIIYKRAGMLHRKMSLRL